MKKVVISLLAAALVPAIGFSQGTINFGTSAAAHVINYDTGGNVDSTFMAQLYFGPSGTTDSGLLVPLGTPRAVADTGFLVPAVVVQTPDPIAYAIQVRAWKGGATYESATEFIGATSVFELTTGNPNGVPPTSPALLAGWTSPLLVTPVPEPTTFVLAGLGLAGLLVLRRKKA